MSDGLYWKHKAFADEWLSNGMNGTQAYKDVYQVDDDNHAAAGASRLLRNDKVSAYIKERLEENAMTAEEALSRLADMARGNLADFLNVDRTYARIDLKKAAESGKLQLLKKYTAPSKVSAESIELYDAQRALETILKAHGVFRDGGDVEVTINIESAKDNIMASIEKAMASDDAGAAQTGS